MRTTERSLWGKTIRTAAGWIRFEPEEDDGGAGVREPRRPKPFAPAGAMAAEIELEEAVAW